MRRGLLFCIAVSMLLTLCSCGAQGTKNDEVAGTPSATPVESIVAESGTASPEEVVASPVASMQTPRPGYSAAQTIFPIETGGNKRFPIIENTTGKTLIEGISRDDYYNTTFMLVSKDGTIVVMDPRDMPKQDQFKFTPDIITITHSHDDHNDNDFVNAFKDTVKLLKYDKTNDVTVGGIRVYSILSDHSGDKINTEKPTNMIFVYEVDGLRIADLGDIGQTKLTDDQLNQLGPIDILITQLENRYSVMNYKKDTKAKDVISQIKPKILIPTHGGDLYDKDIAQYLGADYEMVDTILAVDAAELKTAKQKVVTIKQLEKY